MTLTCQTCGDNYETYHANSKFCSQTCNGAHQRAEDFTDRYCVQCEALIPVRGSSKYHNTRLYCNNACRADARRQPIEPRACKHCGEDIPRKKRQSPEAYKKLVYCCSDCRGSARRKTEGVDLRKKPKRKPKVGKSKPVSLAKKRKPKAAKPKAAKPQRTKFVVTPKFTFKPPTVFQVSPPKDDRPTCPNHPHERLNYWGKCSTCVIQGNGFKGNPIYYESGRVSHDSRSKK